MRVYLFVCKLCSILFCCTSLFAAEKDEREVYMHFIMNGQSLSTGHQSYPVISTKNLKGNLMLVTGDMDKNVNPAHTYRLAQALIEAGKDFDMLVIPGAGHGYGSADKYFEKKMYRFFAKHLLGDTRADYWGDINRNK